MKANTVTAFQLTREELLEVVSARIKSGCSLFYETGNPCIAMIDKDDKLISWANGLRKIPFKFIGSEDFVGFCMDVAASAGLTPESREQPEGYAYIPTETMYRFK